MPANVTLSAGALYGFLLVLARVGGALIFVPLPGVKGAPEPARVALALGFTLALFSRWPVMQTDGVTVATLAGWALAEAAVGLAIGVSVAIALEAFTLAAQVLGLQAGYAYASTIDPNYRGRFRHPAGLRATDGRNAVLRHGAGPRGPAPVRA